jgi:hypothetical protein
MKETKELVLFAAKVLRQVLEASKDGFQLQDIALFLDEAMDAPAAIAGINHISQEFKDASVSDINTLMANVKAILADQIEDEVLLETVILSLNAIFMAIKLRK